MRIQHFYNPVRILANFTGLITTDKFNNRVYRMGVIPYG